MAKPPETSARGGAVGEFLVSSASADPGAAAQSLAHFVEVANAAPDMTVLKTIGDAAGGLKVVVVAAPPEALSQAVGAIPDLQTEKNQPLELFKPDF